MAKPGDRVKDRINGFIGIVTGRAEYLFGCVHLLVAPVTVGTDGKHPDSVWLDEDRCEVVTVGEIAMPSTAAARAGGPSLAPMPSRR